MSQMPNDTTNNIIQSLWIGRPLSSTEQLCIRSFLANGHDFHLYTYGTVAGVPEGTTIRDAREIFPESKVHQNNREGMGKGSYTFFANLFRFALLHQRGGWWVDMDTVCLRPFDLAESDIVATSFEAKWGVLANNNVMKTSPGNVVMGYCADRHAEKLESGDLPFAYGPRMLQEAVRLYPDKVTLAPFEYFNPLSWRHTVYLTRSPEPIWTKAGLSRFLGRREKIGKITPQTYSVHLWNECWSQNKLDRNATYPSSSIIEQLKAKYPSKGEITASALSTS